jgi:aminoglycoside phosphotransferase (APT) family kinase protein
LPESSATSPLRRLTYDLDLEQVRAIVGAYDPSLSPVGFGRLHGGSTEVYRIDLAGSAEPLVLKLYPDEPAWTPAKEALVAGWFEGRLDAPTPRWLRLDESRTLAPLRYALTGWLPGQTVRSLRDDPDIAGLYRQMGALLRRVHTIPMAAYGYILAGGIHRPRATNAESMTDAFEAAFRQFRERGGDAALARRLEAAARARFDLLDFSCGPVLGHDDFQPGNLLAARDAEGALRLTGLIDFGNARAGDAVLDLAKALFCCDHEDPRIRAPLLEGYGAIDHPDPEGALALYTLYHRLTMWVFLVGIGQDPASPGPAGLMRDLAAMPFV